MQYPDYQPALESPPLSDEELQALDELLSGLDSPEAMNVEAVGHGGNLRRGRPVWQTWMGRGAKKPEKRLPG